MNTENNRDENFATSSTHIPSLSLDTSISEETRKELYSSAPPSLETTSSGETYVESGREDTDSDSEQFITSPAYRDSDHDGDEETERERRQRRRRGERERDRGEWTERRIELLDLQETEEEEEREIETYREYTSEETEINGNDQPREAENENRQNEENEANSLGEEREEREGTESGRVFVGTGWWFLAILLFVQLYQSGTVF